MSGVLKRIIDGRLVAVLRASRYEQPAALTAALVAGGVPVVEFTLTGENALEAIEAARAVDGATVLAGSVTDPQTARRAVDAGAEAVVSPVAAIPVAQAALDVPVILAGLTPTELWQAWEATGAPVKLFPASLVGGPRYVKAVRAPLPHIQLMPSGGVSAENAREYLDAGAVALNVGGNLCPPELLETGNAAELERRAAALSDALR